MIDKLIYQNPPEHKMPIDQVIHLLAPEHFLAPTNIEGKLNKYHYKKQWKRRFVVREEEGIVTVILRNSVFGFMQALYLSDKRKLIAVSGIFSLHWRSIQRIFKEEYGDDIEIIGYV